MTKYENIPAPYQHLENLDYPFDDVSAQVTNSICLIYFAQFDRGCLDIE